MGTLISWLFAPLFAFLAVVGIICLFNIVVNDGKLGMGLVIVLICLIFPPLFFIVIPSVLIGGLVLWAAHAMSRR